MNWIDLWCAYYWWAANHHGGQGAREYRRLCQVSKRYKPGALERGPNNDESRDYYNRLCQRNLCKHAPEF